MSAHVEPGTSQEETEISVEIAALHDASFGGPVRSLSTFAVDDVVLCLIDLPLLTAERTLLEGGASPEGLRDTRCQFEHSVRASMVAVVEHSIGREVVGFFTDAQLDPPVTIAVFRLAPAAR